MREQKRSQKVKEKKDEAKPPERSNPPMPPPGPHADPRLTNPDATPGSGAMSDPEKQGGEVDGGTG